MLKILFALLTSGLAFGQTPAVQPDCPLRQYIFTAVGVTVPVNNIATGCTIWVVEYQSIGFSGISLSLQAAFGTVVPGTFGSWGGTIVNGVDPQTVSPGSGVTRYSDTTTSGSPGYYASFVELNLSTATGSGEVIATMYGYKAGSAGVAGGGGGGGGGSGCPGTVGTPCVTGAESSAGAAKTDFVCDQSSVITITGSGLTQIIPATSGKAIHLCSISYSSSGLSNVTIEQGTGTNCGSGTTAVTGAYQNTSTLALDFTPRGTLTFTTGAAACLNFGTSVTSGGVAVYALF